FDSGSGYGIYDLISGAQSTLVLQDITLPTGSIYSFATPLSARNVTSSATVTVPSLSASQGITFTGGTLTATGNLTASGNIAFNGGIVVATGAIAGGNLSIATGATVTLNTATVNGN